MELTRLLYAVDEVEHMCNMIFILGDKYEAIWWYYEYYESNNQERCFTILYKAYYDFYAHKNPELYKLIEQNWKLWKIENSFYYISEIIHNMYLCEYTTEVFHLRNDSNNYQPVYFRGRKPNWLIDNFPNNYHKLIMSIHNNRTCNLIHYVSNEYDAFKYVIKYYEIIKKTDIKNDIDTYFNKVFNNDIYNDIHHYILALIIYFNESSNNINIDTIFEKQPNDVFVLINNIKSTYDNSRKQNILFNCRRYYIRKEINRFNLNRHTFKNRNELRDYITYHSDVELEFDEQPLSVQDASIGCLSVQNASVQNTIIKQFQQITL
jgi:hypothetical protein